MQGMHRGIQNALQEYIWYIIVTTYGGSICTNDSYWPMDVSLLVLGSNEEK